MSKSQKAKQPAPPPVAFAVINSSAKEGDAAKLARKRRPIVDKARADVRSQEDVALMQKRQAENKKLEQKRAKEDEAIARWRAKQDKAR